MNLTFEEIYSMDYIKSPGPKDNDIDQRKISINKDTLDYLKKI